MSGSNFSKAPRPGLLRHFSALYPASGSSANPVADVARRPSASGHGGEGPPLPPSAAPVRASNALETPARPRSLPPFAASAGGAGAVPGPLVQPWFRAAGADEPYSKPEQSHSRAVHSDLSPPVPLFTTALTPTVPALAGDGVTVAHSPQPQPTQSAPVSFQWSSLITANTFPEDAMEILYVRIAHFQTCLGSAQAALQAERARQNNTPVTGEDNKETRRNTLNKLMKKKNYTKGRVSINQKELLKYTEAASKPRPDIVSMRNEIKALRARLYVEIQQRSPMNREIVNSDRDQLIDEMMEKITRMESNVLKEEMRPEPANNPGS
jgi:hypothetical protein